MAEEAPEPPIPLGLRLGVALFSLALTLGVAEGLIRWADGGALPHLRLFTQVDGAITLQAASAATLRRADGGTFTVATDAHGLRVGAGPPLGPGAPLVVGDSQVLGMGVSAEEAFPARLGAHNAGVPGHGLPDALAQAQALLASLQPRALVVVVNQANDWEDGTTPLTDRMAVRGGWLIDRQRAEGPMGRLFWGSPLSRSHLLYLTSLLLRGPAPASGPPAWMADPAGQQAQSASLAAAIRDFAAAHPALPLTVAFLPVDVAAQAARAETSPFGPAAQAASPPPWADRQLHDQLAAALGSALPLVDLTPALRADPALFLEADYHLSAAGHAAVAKALAAPLGGP